MIRHFIARPRLTFCGLLGIALLIALPHHWRVPTRLLVAWDAGSGLYILLACWMMFRSDSKQISRRAASEDEGQLAILALTTLAAIASLAAIIAELAKAKNAAGHIEWQCIALSGATVFLSWTFMQTIFALHYAHEFFMENADGTLSGGLKFPGNETPDYWDFVYHSFVIGTAAQTADIEITSRILRRITTLHCVVAFFFNTTIFALTVNIGASLF